MHRPTSRSARRTLTRAAIGTLALALPALALNARIVPTQQQVQEFCGTTRVKIVFENDSAGTTYLYYVDLGETAPQIRRIQGPSAATLATISPDGAAVAFAKGASGAIDDGSGAGSTITGSAWYCQLAATPAFLYQVAATALVPRFVKNSTADTILYSTCRNTLSPWAGCGTTVKRSVSTTSAGSAVTVWAGGSYYGGLSYDNRYLASAYIGGPPGVMLDLQNSSQGPVVVTKLRVQKNSTNADTVVTTGSCNPSISSSRRFTNTMMYMDFGSAYFTNANCHSVLGEWGTHQKIFINRIDGALMKSFEMPADRPVNVDAETGDQVMSVVWDGVEWSNHPYFAVATIIADRPWPGVGPAGGYGHTKNSETMYLINLRDSTYLRILNTTDTSYTSGTSMIRPYAWVEMPAGFAEDSCWLRYTMDERIADPTKRCVPAAIRSTLTERVCAPGVVLSGRTFRADAGISSALVVSLSGARYPQRVHGAPRTLTLPRLSAGVYLVRVTTVDGRSSVVRWTNGW